MEAGADKTVISRVKVGDEGEVFKPRRLEGQWCQYNWGKEPSKRKRKDWLWFMEQTTLIFLNSRSTSNTEIQNLAI